MGYYLCNAIGFLIQFFPFSFVLFLPFDETVLRFPRKWIFRGVIAVSITLASVFPAVLRVTRAVWNIIPGTAVANLYMLCATLLGLAVYLWLVQGRLLKKIMAFYAVLFCLATQYYLALLVFPFIQSLLIPQIPRYDLPAYEWDLVLLYLGMTALLLPLQMAVVIRPLKDFNSEIDPQTMRREFIIATISTTLCLALMFCCNIIWVSFLGGLIIHLMWLLPLSLFLIANQGVIYWLVFRESVRRKRDGDRQRAMEIQKVQYDKIIADMENARRMRHDMRHHYNFLHSMLAQGRPEDAEKYLSKLIGSTEGEGETYCRNMTVNGLLQYYVGLARDEGIHCRIQADCGELTIASEDLTTVFGNALENAIHACQRYPENRWITVQVGTIQGSLVILIANPCREVYLQRRYRAARGLLPAEAFLSGRKGGGYGLRSLAHTAQKYGGEAQFQFDMEKATFTTRIRLDLHTEIL